MGAKFADASRSSDLVRMVEVRAEHAPDQTAFTFLTDGEGAEEDLTYRELERRARAIAALLAREVEAGGRVVLLYPPGLDYIAAFIGCLFGGFVAVPAYPPDPSRLNRSLPRLQAIVEDAGADVILTTSSILAMTEPLKAFAPALGQKSWLASDALPADIEKDWTRPRVGPDTLAFIQYTSGSTGTPKGVMLTHRNLLANEVMIRDNFGLSQGSIGVGWLPLYHDMGLIGNVLQPIYVGFRCVLMSPLDFLRRPARWLQAISRYGGTVSGGPNFSYDLCVRKISREDRERLNLRSWRLAFSGAEPVRAETMDLFARTFADCGFRREAFLPCYGLAEASLLVSGKGDGKEYRVERFASRALEEGRAERAGRLDEGQALVSVGAQAPKSIVRVVDPESRTVRPDGQVGEIWVSGPHVAVGYWRDAEKSLATFGATLSRADAAESELRFLRTGDLGFVVDGELFVSGRIKDLIIIRGRNYYPQDIERKVEDAHPALRRGCSAAFSVQVEIEERLVIAVEVDRRAGAGGGASGQSGAYDTDGICDAIRRSVADHSGVHVHAVVLLEPGSIPKTSSGKIQRHACRAGFVAGTLDVVGTSVNDESTPEPAIASPADVRAAPARERLGLIEEYVRGEIGRALRISAARIDMGSPLSGLGLDSLMAVELGHAIERDLGVVVPPASLLRDGAARGIAAEILSALERPPSSPDAGAPWAPSGDRDARAEHELAAGQAALWFIYRLAPESAAYNLSTALRIRGDLDPAALESALRHMVGRHPALHTVYSDTDDRATQRIEPALIDAFALESIDAGALSQAELTELVAETAHRVFDLVRGPVIRARLCRLSADEHVLVLALHHIAADLWSIVCLVSELQTLYRAASKGSGGDPTPKAPASYRDFVLWQKSYVERSGERDAEYWERQIGDAAALDLPLDRPRPPRQSYRGAARRLELDAEVVEAVTRLARREGVTPYVVLLAAFQALMARYTGQDRFLVGSPMAGRARADFERVVGYFVNPVPLLADLSGDPDVRTFLRRVREVVLGAIEHQSFPLASIAQRVKRAHAPGRPLFDVMFVLEQPFLADAADAAMVVLGATDRPCDLGGLKMLSEPVPRRTAQFDLTLSLAHVEGVLAGFIEYDAELFEGSTVERMATHFEVLLRGMLEWPERSVRELPLMAESERRRVVEEWNETDAPYERACLHELVERQARRTPDATALVSGAKRLTYRELDERSNALAASLVRRGVKSEAIVAVMLERDAELVIGLLGVLKSGAAYAPIDPAYPPERIAFLLEDTGAAVVVTQPSLAGRLGPEYAGRVELVTEERAPRGPEGVGLGPGSRAYVIYTSGSTGRPKGVEIEHQSASAFVSWALQVFDREELGGVLAGTSVCFDLSIFELFVTLSGGGKVLLAPNALSLATLPYRDEVTLLNTVPSVASSLVRSGGIPSSVRTVNLAGEALPAETVKELYALPFIEKVYNLYGPSEDTTYSTYVKATRGGWRPTVGRPIANTRAYVLDDRLHPLPPGLKGEVYLGGAGLARGYLRRPDVTAERFVPNPWGAAGSRLYRTGDIGRLLADGPIEYLGRQDHQVKVRGFRIELGEVEAAIRRSVGVRDVVVDAREGADGTSRLVGYVVGSTDGAKLAEDLRARLPEYMIPHAFVLLPDLPRTPNGKVDRRALPAPDAPRSRPYVAPSTPAQEAMCRIAAELLSVPRIGVLDNFFELGGHSLLAAQFVSRTRSTLRVDMTVRSLFDYPTISQLAAAYFDTCTEEGEV